MLYVPCIAKEATNKLEVLELKIAAKTYGLKSQCVPKSCIAETKTYNLEKGNRIWTII